MAIRYLFKDWRRRRRAIRSYLRSRKATAISSGTDNQDAPPERPARALPKLPTRGERIRRVAVWRKLRPVIRWHRRTPVGIVLGVYFGTLGSLSLLACLFFLLPVQQKKEALPPAPSDNGSVTLALGVSPRNALGQPASVPEAIAILQQQADDAFRNGNFASAENLYRQILPKARLKALTGFHIFLCLLQQGKSAELKLMMDKIPPASTAKNPLGFYARAALDLKAGRPEEAAAPLAAARSQFPEISLFYDQALREAGLPPPEP